MQCLTPFFLCLWLSLSTKKSKKETGMYQKKKILKGAKTKRKKIPKGAHKTSRKKEEKNKKAKAKKR